VLTERTELAEPPCGRGHDGRRTACGWQCGW